MKKFEHFLFLIDFLPEETLGVSRVFLFLRFNLNVWTIDNSEQNLLETS